MFLKKKQEKILFLVVLSIITTSFIFENNVFATTVIHDYNNATGGGWGGNVLWGEKFSGLPNEKINSLSLNITTTGSSHVRAKIYDSNSTVMSTKVTNNYKGSTTTLAGSGSVLIVEPISGLTLGRNITSLTVNQTSNPAGASQHIKVYSSGDNVIDGFDLINNYQATTGTISQGTIWLEKFTFPANVNITALSISQTGACCNSWRMGIYADSGGAPGAKLRTGDGSVSPSERFSPPFMINSSTTLWIGFQIFGSMTVKESTGQPTGTAETVGTTWANWPNPFGGSTSTTIPYMDVEYSQIVHDMPKKLIGGDSLNDGAGLYSGLLNYTFDKPIKINQTKLWFGIESCCTTQTDTIVSQSGLALGSSLQVSHTYGSGPNPFTAYATRQTTAPWMRINLLSNSSGNEPKNLLGESSSTLLSTTGLNNFTIPGNVHVPTSGSVWGVFEVDSPSMLQSYSYGLPGGSATVTAHTFGSGPSIFGTPEDQTFAPWMGLNLSGPSLTISPALGIVGNTATLSGTNFDSNKTISFTFDGMAVTTTPATVTTNSTGGFSGVTFTIPATSNGLKTINGTDTGGATAIASYDVNPSSFSISPTSGNVGTVDSFTGNGFSELDTVTIKFDSSTVDTITSDSVGNISGLFTIPSSTKGSHTITATDTHGNNKTATFTTNTSIAISPTSGSPGKTITISGDGFNSSSTMHIYFNNVLQTTSPGTVTTNSTGSFSGVTFTVPTLPVNTYIVKAIDAGTNQATQNFILHQTVPDAPTLAALALSPTSIRFTSVAGASSGDNPVIWYGLICQTNGGSWTTIVSNSSLPSSRIYERTGLQPGDTVGCEWRDGSKSGWSLWSSEASTSTTLPLVQPPMTNNHLTTFVKWIADHGGIYFGFTIGPFIPMLLGLMATPKTVGIFAVITLMAMGIVHASGLYVYPSWYWGLMLLFGVVLVLSRANEK